MASEQHIYIPNLKRTNKAKTTSRLRNYPVDTWINRAVDTTAPGYEESETGEVPCFVASQGEDFPGISRAHFVQDLHRIAKIATDQTEHGAGYIVRTSASGFPDDQLAFVFYRVPRSEARGSNETKIHRDRQAAMFPSQGVEPLYSPATEKERTDAWQAQATKLLWCHDPAGIYQAHQIGRVGDACPHCATKTARSVTTPTPPVTWTPGQPIPADVP